METTVTTKVKHSLWRTASVLPWLLFIGLVVFAVWRSIDKPSQKVVIGDGGTADFTTINKSSRWFTLFTELGVENRDDDLGFYTRVGGRIEF